MKGWLAYLFGGVLVSAGVGEVGVVVILVGMLAHWKYWLLGILAENAAQNPTVVNALLATRVSRQKGLYSSPLLIRKPKVIRHFFASSLETMNHTGAKLGILFMGPDP